MFPYGRGDYVVALGTDVKDCIMAFKEKYPNRPGYDTLNCADYYEEREWGEIAKNYYKDVKPKDIIISNTAYVCKPEGFDPVWFIVPDKHEAVFLQEGSGSNLDFKDKEAGNVDYLDYVMFKIGHGEINEYDGGIFMMKEYVQDRYGCLAEAIPDILDVVYDDPYMDVQIINFK